MQLKNFRTTKKTFFIAGFLLLLMLFSGVDLSANTIEELEQKIESQRSKIEEIEREIAEQRKNINRTAQDAQSLSGAIAELESAKASLQKSIQRTQSEIDESELTIEKIGLEITSKQASINLNRDAIARSIRSLQQLDSISLLESFMSESVNDVWTYTHSLQKVQEAVFNQTQELKGLKVELSEKQSEEELAKQELVFEQRELDGERTVVQQAQNEKDELLRITQNKQATYEAVLAQKVKEKEEFEQQLFDFESQLKIAIDPTLYAQAGKGSFSWPVDNIVVTQLFGRTAFAQSFSGYERPFHNGIDFGVPLGTPVKSVMDGVVVGTGNTDLYPGCNSWGGWVLVEHQNGLSTLYAHLSSSLVSAGETVTRGQKIALSGSTGVSTGPHLHLTVYASQGVKVRTFKEIFPGRTYGCAAGSGSIPTASLDSYLDPSDYLPG